MKHNVLRNASVLFLSFILVSFQTFAQRTVTGKITDGETGEGIPGASVVIKGTTSGTISDFEGNYSISVEDGATLVISFVGYQSSEVAVGARSVVDVRLSTDLVALEEIVVVGYGQTTVKDATGAVSAVTSKDFNGGVIASPEQLIQGKTAGVQITSAGGEPGAGVAFNIRGSNSVTANNNPLFVIDGVPLDGQPSQGSGRAIGFGTSAPRNPLNFLNPNDIESVSILKDASATAIYGSRGANGVVIITTKKARGNQPVFEYTSSYSVSSTRKRIDLLSGPEFLDEINRRGGNVTENDFGSNTDWQDQIFRTAFSTNQNFAYSKGFETGAVRASIGYDNQNGVVENSSLERLTLRLNGNKTFLDDKLRLDVQGTYSRVNDERAPLSGSAGFAGDLIGAAYSANPTWPADADFADTGGLRNPLNMLEAIRQTGETDRFLLNTSISYELTDGLVAKFTYGLDRSFAETIGITSPEGRNLGNGVEGNGRGAFNELDVNNNLYEATLTWTKDFGNSNIEVVGGYSFQDFGRSGLNGEGWGFAAGSSFDQLERDLISSLNRTEAFARNNVESGFLQQFGIASNLDGVFANILTPPTSTQLTGLGTPANPVASVFGDRFDNTDELQSFFGRINYGIQGKYLFTFTARGDGSSRFGDNNRYGFFPSGAFAWQIAEENFAPDVFSTLKLRLSAGITGNQDGLGFGNAIGRERFAGDGGGVISDGGEINIPGTNPVAFENRNLQWEETTQYTIGIDLGVNNDRFEATIDLYRKNTQELLLNTTAAQPSPQPFVFQNLDASVINQGVEISLNYSFIQSSDFDFSVGFNLAYNDDEIQDFNGLIEAGTIRGPGLTGAFAQTLANNQPLFAFFLRPFFGFDEGGQPNLEDVQQFVNASALPSVNTGLNLSANYRNWDFAAYFNGQFGHSIYNNTANAFFTAGTIGSGRNVSQSVVNNGESTTASAEVSTRFLESGDFVRLQTLSVGYNFPLNDSFFNTLRVSLTGQNLFVIDSYSGVDPEVSTQPADIGTELLNGIPIAGIDLTAFPRPRTFTLGISASF